jgi:endoglucanase
VALARRYRQNPTVVGFDLRNEPHSNGPGTEILALGYLRQGATWGPYHGVDNPRSDWQQAAERAGDAILRANPRLLIIVEGTEIYPNADGTPDIYWWGGNLRGALAYPVHLDVPHQLVYSAHEYGPDMHGQRWFSRHMTESDWQKQFQQHWGMLLSRRGPDAAPVWIGEFGTPHGGKLDVHSTQAASEGQWFTALVRYMRRNHVGWAYWAINGTMSGGPYGRRYGAPDSFGLLTPDWRHLSSPLLMKALRSIEP